MGFSLRKGSRERETDWKPSPAVREHSYCGKTLRNHHKPTPRLLFGTFSVISPLDFEFRQNYSVPRPVFFSVGVRIFCRRDYFGNKQIHGQRFLFRRQTIFCVSKPTFLHQTARFVKIKSTVPKMSGMEAMF